MNDAEIRELIRAEVQKHVYAYHSDVRRLEGIAAPESPPVAWDQVRVDWLRNEHRKAEQKGARTFTVKGWAPDGSEVEFTTRDAGVLIQALERI